MVTFSNEYLVSFQNRALICLIPEMLAIAEDS